MAYCVVTAVASYRTTFSTALAKNYYILVANNFVTNNRRKIVMQHPSTPGPATRSLGKLESVVQAFFQGFIKSFLHISISCWAIRQLQCNQATYKLQEEL